MFWTTAHISFHILVPGVVARMGFAPHWKKAWAVMVSTMVVDVDHLLATPIFDPSRCSLGFHPLHTWPAIMGYFLMTLFPKTRWVGLGLIIHMAVDGVDCLL